MHGSFSNAEGGLTKNFWSGVLGKVINLDFFRAWEKIFPMQDMNKVSQWEKKKRYMGEKAGISIFYMALLKGAVCLGCE